MNSKSLIIIAFVILRNGILYAHYPNIYILVLISSIDLFLCLLLTRNNSSSNIENKKEILKIIENKNLKEFQDYLKKNKISPEQLTKMEFPSHFTPLLYTFEEDSFEIFKYMIDYGVDINYTVTHHLSPVQRAVYYDTKYMKELLKYKEKLNLKEKAGQFNANCLEIAVWRNRPDIVKLLLEAGMEFSISEYNQTICGLTLVPFDQVSMEVKRELIRNKIYEMKKPQFILANKIIKKEIKIDCLSTKPYILENFLNYS